MYINEIFAGRFVSPPKVTSFPNMGYRSLYTSGPISVKSTCAHHFQPPVPGLRRAGAHWAPLRHKIPSLGAAQNSVRSVRTNLVPRTFPCFQRDDPPATRRQ